MKVNKVFEIINDVIHNYETLAKARFSEKSFTRNRKMPFSDVLCFFFDLRKTSLQTRLNLFFKGGKHPTMSHQAFSKSRNKFDHSPFEKMHRDLIRHEYTEEAASLPTWNGYHVMAIDGSYLQLPKEPELAEAFGTRGAAHCVSAGVSVLYDVLNGFPVDPAITHSDMNERKECEKHIEHLCRELPGVASKSVVLLDRGYPSEGLFVFMESKGLKYLARCKSNYCKKTEAAPMGDSTVRLNGGLLVRVYKFALPSGEVETLLTNLFEEPAEGLPELYAMRWGIEGSYGRLKNTVCLENFSGRTGNSVKQDFWASMVLMVAVAVFQKEANGEIEEEQRHKANKHRYQASVGDLAVALRDEFIFAVLRKNKILSAYRIKRIIATLAYSKSPVRPGRSFPRYMNRNVSHNLNLKSHL
jgi:hypothetical protein